MENSTNGLQDGREMDRRTILKGAAVAAGALCGAGVMGLSGCSTPMADTGEQASMDELMKKMQEPEDRLWVAEAKEEIRYKLCMYARGDDRQDTAIGKTVYAEDSYVDFGWHLTSEKLQIPYGCAFDETDPSYDVLAYGA